MMYERTNMTPPQADRCDIRIWSGDCRQSSYSTDGEKYLCASCGVISSLDHEVNHGIFPYVSGDYDTLT